ncbi:hypothetical protein L1049_003352 [Liquidambar formosana]|uniref:Cytochrome P450 n=1 Tax=Liquidambar formosana TaxID=63359 RepID=A0AAP0NGK8_LIQFO
MAIVGYVEIILVAILCFCFFCHRRWNNENSALFTNWPLVGMLPGLLGNAQRVHECATQLLKQSGYTFEFKGPWSANMDFLLTSNVQNLQHILIKNFPNFQKGSAFKKIFDVLGDGILGAESDSWKTQRQLIHSLMKKSRFQRHLEKAIQHKVEKGLLPILEHVSKLGLEVDMQELFQRFTFDNSCMFMFGFDPGSLSIDFPEVSAAKAVNDIEEALIYRHIVPECCWKLQRWIQIGEEKKLSRAREIFDRFIDRHVLLKRERRRSKTQKEEVDEEESFDLVTGFMEEEEKADTGVSAFKISDKFLRDLVWNLLAAGERNCECSSGLVFLACRNEPISWNQYPRRDQSEVAGKRR